jgi:hypothetical protein
MDKRESKARIEAQMDEWKLNLDAMKAKADAATGDAKVAYAEQIALLQKQYDEVKVKAATVADIADDKWEATAKDLENTWDDWVARAKKAKDDLVG